MNSKFIFIMLVAAIVLLAFVTVNAAEKCRCSVSSDCYKPCWKKDKCSRGKCINKTCKCYNCQG
uniref:Putative Potassium channel toxin n=1 Tax=Megacormus gertschi TaxID=1843536 RepID=A0A224XGD9_9SCOR